MIIECPECSNKISNQAATCPSCGIIRIVQTIEKTGKGWKFVQLVGGLIVGIGVVFGYLEWREGIFPSEGFFIYPGMGVVLYLSSRIGVWWYHG